MVDIAMCGNEDCPMAEMCFRHEAKPDPWRQCYAEFSWKIDSDSGDVECNSFIPLRGGERT